MPGILVFGLSPLCPIRSFSVTCQNYALKGENQEIGSSSLSLENSDTKPDRLSQKLT